MKLHIIGDIGLVIGVAPYAGAWIEITLHQQGLPRTYVAPYAGAWIEIFSHPNSPYNLTVAPYAGAWIEIGGNNL